MSVAEAVPHAIGFPVKLGVAPHALEGTPGEEDGAVWLHVGSQPQGKVGLDVDSALRRRPEGLARLV